MRAEGGDVNSVAFSPDGGQIAAGFEDGPIRIWFISPGTGVDEG